MSVCLCVRACVAFHQLCLHALQGAGIGPTIQIGEQTVITVDAKAAGKGKVTCSVCTPEGAELDVDVVENEDGTFDIFYTAPQPGEYVICVRFGGEHIPNSPFQVTVSVGVPAWGGKGQSRETERLWGLPGCPVFSKPLCFIPPPPPPPSACQALEGAPSEQLLQQSQVPQYYAPQPWVPPTSSLSLPVCPSPHQLLSSCSSSISVYCEQRPLSMDRRAAPPPSQAGTSQCLVVASCSHDTNV